MHPEHYGSRHRLTSKSNWKDSPSIGLPKFIRVRMYPSWWPESSLEVFLSIKWFPLLKDPEIESSFSFVLKLRSEHDWERAIPAHSTDV